MSYLYELGNDRRICWGPTRSSVKRGTTVQNSPFFPSPHNAPGKTRKTNGSRRSSGIA
jgi:hypothetical protein